MNALIDRYTNSYSPNAGDFKIIGIPCNQFGLQEPGSDLREIKNGIKYVRPGNGYVPGFNLTQKMDVNGYWENRFYTFVKSQCPAVSEILGNPDRLFWSPMRTTDIQWNFEKFLIDRVGRVRYRIKSRIVPDTSEVLTLITELLNE